MSCNPEPVISRETDGDPLRAAVRRAAAEFRASTFDEHDEIADELEAALPEAPPFHRAVSAGGSADRYRVAFAFDGGEMAPSGQRAARLHVTVGSREVTEQHLVDMTEQELRGLARIAEEAADEMAAPTVEDIPF